MDSLKDIVLQLIRCTHDIGMLALGTECFNGLQFRATLETLDKKVSELTQPSHPLEIEIPLSDGTTVKVHGLFAVQFRKDPEGTRQAIERLYNELRLKQSVAGIGN